MTSIAIANNPNMNILFVRIIGHNQDGTRKPTTNVTVSNALNWIYQNKDKYNIIFITDYLFFSSITNHKIASPIKWYDDVIVPKKNNYDFLLINTILIMSLTMCAAFTMIYITYFSLITISIPKSLVIYPM